MPLPPAMFLGVGDDEIDPLLLDERRQLLMQDLTARPADDVTET